MTLFQGECSQHINLCKYAISGTEDNTWFILKVVLILGDWLIHGVWMVCKSWFGVLVLIMLLRNNGILETSLRVRFLIFMMPILNPTLRHRWKNNVSQEHKKLGVEEAGVLIICCYLTNCVRCLVAQLCPTLCKPMDCSLPGSSVHGDSPGKNTRVGCLTLLQGLCPTQGLNASLLHCRQFFTVWATREVHLANYS